MPTTLIINGTITDPSQQLQRKADLLLKDGKIAAIGHDLGKADKVIDATGQLITPGLIDIHVHFREPGDRGRRNHRLRGGGGGGGGIHHRLLHAQHQAAVGY